MNKLFLDTTLEKNLQQNVKIREHEQSTFNKNGSCVCFHFFLPRSRRNDNCRFKFVTKK